MKSKRGKFVEIVWTVKIRAAQWLHRIHNERQATGDHGVVPLEIPAHASQMQLAVCGTESSMRAVSIARRTRTGMYSSTVRPDYP